jgi:predicted NBD/HSP70 family sugar kinase
MSLSATPSPESGTNLARVKDFNQVVVLDLIRSRGELTRPAIAEATGLTLQTVSNIVRRLLAAGVVLEESVAGAPRGGRAQRRLRVNDDAAYAIGIKLDRDRVVVAVVNLAGEIKARETFAIVGNEPPADVVSRMAHTVNALLAAAAVPRARVLGAGIGAPGPLDLRSGQLLTPLHFEGWDNFELRSVVSDALGMRVIMDNDATAAAVGEQWRGLGIGVSNLVYLYLGRGLGSGMILSGQAFRGLRGNAGEISHVQVDPSGPPCECGANGCLGLYATPEGLLREARRAVLEAPSGAPPFPQSTDEVLAGSHPLFVDVIARAADRLARLMVEFSRVLEPELIVLGGPHVDTLGRPYQEAIALRLALIDAPGAPPPRVELSRIGTDAGVIGAATLMLHDLYAPSMGKLSLAGLTGSPPGEAPPSTGASHPRSSEQ